MNTPGSSLFSFHISALRERLCDRQFVCSRCGRFGCLDRVCMGGVDV